jgi:hypothetical protein
MQPAARSHPPTLDEQREEFAPRRFLAMPTAGLMTALAPA